MFCGREANGILQQLLSGWFCREPGCSMRNGPIESLYSTLRHRLEASRSYCIDQSLQAIWTKALTTAFEPLIIVVAITNLSSIMIAESRVREICCYIQPRLYSTLAMFLLFVANILSPPLVPVYYPLIDYWRNPNSCTRRAKCVSC